MPMSPSNKVNIGINNTISGGAQTSRFQKSNIAGSLNKNEIPTNNMSIHGDGIKTHRTSLENFEPLRLPPIDNKNAQKNNNGEKKTEEIN